MDGRAIRDNRRRIDIAPQTTPPARADAADSTPAAQSASPPQVGRVASPSGRLSEVQGEINTLENAQLLLERAYLGGGAVNMLYVVDAIGELLLPLKQERRDIIAAIHEARS